MAIGQPPTVDYTIDVQTPFQAAVQGLQFAAGRETLEAARTQRDVEAQTRQRELEQQRLNQAALTKFQQTPFSQVTPADVASLTGVLPAQSFTALSNLVQTQSETKNAGIARNYGQMLAAVKQGFPEQAKNLATELAGAEPDPSLKRGYEILAQGFENAPDASAKSILLAMQGLGGDYTKLASKIIEMDSDGDFKILTDADRIAAGLPEGVYQKGPKGETKLLSAKKEDFKLLTPAEVKAAGLPAGTYQKSPTGEIKAVVKQPLVQVSLGEKRNTLALKELDVPRAQEFSQAAATARRFANDARVISTLLKGKGGGALLKLSTQLQKDFGFESDSVSAQDLANSLATRGATTMRAPGSGSTSDIEFKSFLAAFPSLSNSERGRELMAKYADAFAKRSAKIADHARKLIRSDTYSEEEIGRFDESLGSVLDKDFYDSVNTGPRANVPKYSPQAAPAAPAAAAAAPRTVDSVLQQYLQKP